MHILQTNTELTLRRQSGGPSVTLSPYNETTDARPLFDLTPDGTLRYFPACPTPWTFDTFRAWLSALAAGQTTLTFTARDGTGAIVGCTSYYELDAHNHAAEIGATWYAPHAQGTRINPECKLLLLAFAFEGGLARALNWSIAADAHPCERVQLKCDARNLRSQRAIEKLGATKEGILRRHRICSDGFVRDTVVYSITATEWPAIKARLEQRLAATPP